VLVLGFVWDKRKDEGGRMKAEKREEREEIYPQMTLINTDKEMENNSRGNPFRLPR